MKKKKRRTRVIKRARRRRRRRSTRVIKRRRRRSTWVIKGGRRSTRVSRRRRNTLVIRKIRRRVQGENISVILRFLILGNLALALSFRYWISWIIQYDSFYSVLCSLISWTWDPFSIKPIFLHPPTCNDI